jgi:putative inorganic carbon (HCO3(-)) transporter
MKGYLVFAIVVVLLPRALIDPFYGMMYYNWFALFKPEWLFAGFPRSIPMAMVAALATFISWMASKERKIPPGNATTILIFAILIWMGVTTFFALDRERAWAKYSDMIKILPFALIMATMLNTALRVKIALAVLCLSVAFFGVKGGIHTITSGGSARIYGPDHSVISDNNDFGVILATIIPLLIAVRSLCPRPWMRHAMSVVIFLNVLSALFTYSRGGLLALCAMILMAWWRSRRKFATGILIALSVVLFLQLAPRSFFERADTISDYQEDSSAQQRLDMWVICWTMAKQRPIVGAGFWWLQNRGNMFAAADAAGVRHPIVGAAHSIYFENLGDHGFVGLGLYLALVFVTLRNGQWLAKNAGTSKENEWAVHFGRMLPASLVGYLVGGAFVTVSTFEGFYQLFIIVAGARWVVSRQLAESASSQALQPIAPAVSAMRPAFAAHKNQHLAGKIPRAKTG